VTLNRRQVSVIHQRVTRINHPATECLTDGVISCQRFIPGAEHARQPALRRAVTYAVNQLANTMWSPQTRSASTSIPAISFDTAAVGRYRDKAQHVVREAHQPVSYLFGKSMYLAARRLPAQLPGRIARSPLKRATVIPVRAVVTFINKKVGTKFTSQQCS
jgi:hypothetical protein